LGKSTSRVSTRKTKDKWRAKTWYRVLAPDIFDGIELTETLSHDPSNLMGRKTEVTLQDLTQDFSKMHIKLQFQVNEVRGTDAYTKFIGQTLTSDYIRRQTKRKRSKMDGVYDVYTKDGYMVRVKPMAISDKRIQSSKQAAIRYTMGAIIEREAQKRDLEEFINYMIIEGDLSRTIHDECKGINPIRRVEIRRSEILKEPAESPKKKTSKKKAATKKKASEKEKKEDEAKEKAITKKADTEEAPVEEASEDKPKKKAATKKKTAAKKKEE